MLKFVKDLGMKYQTPRSKTKIRLYLVECSGCNKTHKIQAAQFKAGYTNWCIDCGKASKKKELKCK